MSGKFEIYKDKRGEFRFRLKAGNGENILSGEGYTSKAACQNGVESVKKNAPLDERYERKTSTSDKPYFVLKAGNHQVIGQSQMYASDASRNKGIEAVKRAAPDAAVVELEE